MSGTGYCDCSELRKKVRELETTLSGITQYGSVSSAKLAKLEGELATLRVSHHLETLEHDKLKSRFEYVVGEWKKDEALWKETEAGLLSQINNQSHYIRCLLDEVRQLKEKQ